MNRNVLSLLILAGFLLLTACDGRISLQHTPTPKCIGDTWSYAENILTKIKIDPDLRITMVRLENAISEIRVGES